MLFKGTADISVVFFIIVKLVSTNRLWRKCHAGAEGEKAGLTIGLKNAYN